MKRIIKYGLPITAGVFFFLAIYQVVGAARTQPPSPPPVEPPSSAFGQTVGGTGIVEPWTENISIGAALPGIVLEVYVPVEKVGQKVKKGDPLFLVDNRQLLATLKYNEANLKAARAQLAKLDAQPHIEEVRPSEAKVSVAEAGVALQEDLADRARRLRPTGAMNEEDANQRQLNLNMSRQQLAQSRAELALLKVGAWREDKDIASANIALAEAQLQQTRTDLERSLVRAPHDGVILQVNVREGEYVGAPPGQALMVLGATEGKLHIRVDINEHDIPRFRPGAAAVASPRGKPSIKYPLHFDRVEPYVIPKKSLTGDNTERVDTRVLQVIYAVDSAQAPLYVGQQVDVFIDAAE